MNYKKNVGRLDQMIRYGLAIVFLFLSFWVNLWFFIGTIVFFISAYFEFCPIYKIFGFSTYKIKDK